MAKRKAIYTHTLTREYLVQQYIDAHRTINDIARETGFDQLTVRRRLCAHGIPLRKRSDAESHQLTGRVFGLLTVGPMLRKRQRSGAVIYYRCVCTCGAVREVRAAHLIAGASKACKRCASGHSASSPHWTGCGEITGYYWGRVCRGAKQRGLVVEITIEQAWQVFLRQKRRCALTDLPLVMLGGNAAESEPTASLDRIDSKLGYVAGNVQWVHKDINRMKNDFEETYFRELCRLITEQLAYRKSPKA